MSVFLFPNRIKDTDFSVTRQVIALLDQHGIHALLTDELAGELMDTKAVFLPQQQALAQAKQVITIGGDGTLLRIAHDCLAQSKPVLGVNLGRIGFLATCEVAELPEKLARLAAGRYTIEPRNLLRADAPAHNWHQVAMNDVVLFGNSRLHPMDYTVYCDGAFVSRNTHGLHGLLAFRRWAGAGCLCGGYGAYPGLCAQHPRGAAGVFGQPYPDGGGGSNQP